MGKKKNQSQKTKYDKTNKLRLFCREKWGSVFNFTVSALHECAWKCVSDIKNMNIWGKTPILLLTVKGK